MKISTSARASFILTLLKHQSYASGSKRIWRSTDPQPTDIPKLFQLCVGIAVATFI
jgi:hypothetical protein